MIGHWREAAVVAAGASEDVTFVPVGVVEGIAPRAPALLAPPEPTLAPEFPPADGKAVAIEIVLPGGARISVDASIKRADKQL